MLQFALGALNEASMTGGLRLGLDCCNVNFLAPDATDTYLVEDPNFGSKGGAKVSSKVFVLLVVEPLHSVLLCR